MDDLILTFRSDLEDNGSSTQKSPSFKRPLILISLWSLVKLMTSENNIGCYIYKNREGLFLVTIIFGSKSENCPRTRFWGWVLKPGPENGLWVVGSV